MSDNWKPIDRVREYGNQTKKVETSEFPNEPIKNFMNNCNLTTCRYNENGKCTNEEKRKECVGVSEKVLCVDKEKFMDEIREAFEFLKEIADDIGTTGMEYRSCKDGDKMREYIRLLEDKIDELAEK